MEIDSDGRLFELDKETAREIVRILSSKDSYKGSEFLKQLERPDDLILRSLMYNLSSRKLKEANIYWMMVGARMARDVYARAHGLRNEREGECESIVELKKRLIEELGQERYRTNYGPFLDKLSRHYAGLSGEFSSERAARQLLIAEKDEKYRQERD